MADRKEDFGPAVLSGRLMYVSPSAISRHANCKRSWWFRYVQGLKDPPGKSAIAGTEGHARIERYLKTGKLAELSDREWPAVQFMPKPLCHPPLFHVECSVSGLAANGIPIVGYMDLIDDSDTTPVITDWKFKTSFENLPTEDDLRNPDTDAGRQLLIYAAAYYAMPFHHAEEIALRHVYISLKGATKAEQHTNTIKKGFVQEAWQYIVTKYIEPIRQTAKATKPEDIDGKANFCYAYHRACPFMGICPQHKSGDALMGLFTDITNKPETNIQVVLPPDVPPAPQIVTTPEAATEMSAEPVKRRGRPSKAQTPVTAPPEVSPTQSEPMVPEPYFYRGCFPVGVQTTTLRAFVTLLENLVLEKFGVMKARDMRLAEHDALKFGKWKAVLSALATDAKLEFGHYIVGSEEKEMVVFEALSAKAANGHVIIGG